MTPDQLTEIDYLTDERLGMLVGKEFATVQQRQLARDEAVKRVEEMKRVGVECLDVEIKKSRIAQVEPAEDLI